MRQALDRLSGREFRYRDAVAARMFVAAVHHQDRSYWPQQVATTKAHLRRRSAHCCWMAPPPVSPL